MEAAKGDKLVGLSVFVKRDVSRAHESVADICPLSQKEKEPSFICLAKLLLQLLVYRHETKHPFIIWHQLWHVRSLAGLKNGDYCDLDKSRKQNSFSRLRCKH